ncbi:hypothetical protein EBT25_12710, partial [bacterium]|nr:hypothetical protein [bacterium]
MTIVCATPRSGATIFAMDLAKKQDAFFANEVTPNNLSCFRNRLNIKQTHHELHYQPQFEPEQFFDIVKRRRDPSVVILVNSTHMHWLYDEAEYFIARRNQLTWSMSVINFWMKTNQAGMTPQALEPAIRYMID